MIRDPELLNQLVDTIARFVRERLIPNEARLAEEDAVPAEILAEMKEMGLFGLSIPEEYGGLGLTMEEEALVAMEIGKTSPAFRSVFGTNNGIGAQGILIDGTEEQKAKYVPRLATGEILSSFCLTEPDSGSDAASLRTTSSALTRSSSATTPPAPSMTPDSWSIPGPMGVSSIDGGKTPLEGPPTAAPVSAPVPAR